MKPIIACAPVGAPGYAPGPAYTETTCPKCNCKMWIGPESRKKRDAGILAVSMICVVQGGARLENVQMFNPNSGSHGDLAAFEAGFDQFMADRAKEKD